MKKFIAPIAFTTLFSLTAAAQNASNPITGNATTLQLTPSSTAAYTVDNIISLDASTTYSGATVSISSGFQSGDVLAYTAVSGITGTYNSTTGVLTFSGTATAASYQSELRSVTLKSTAAASGTAKAVAFSVGSALTYSGNGHYYQFISGSNTWQLAKYRADTMRLYGMHGYLATVTSSGENSFIQQKLQADGWIGSSDNYQQINKATGAATYASQTASEGHWYWVTGPEKGTNFSNGDNSPVTVSGQYANWNSGEPNNVGSTGENCGEIYSSGTTAGRWNDLDSNNSLGFVVEYGGMAGDPSVSLTFTRNIAYTTTAVNGSRPTSNYSTVTGGRQYIDTSITVTGGSSISNAVVTINNVNNGDTLSIKPADLLNGVTASYSAGALTFTGSASAAQWQAMFRKVAYSRSNTTEAPRSITFALGGTGSYTKTLTTSANPLALTWVSFDGQAVNNNAQLIWKTADEKNTASFDIEHSADGKSFEKIGDLNADGSGNNTYTFTDNNATEGNNYYRLKQIDNDGTFQYSKVINVAIKNGKTAAVTEVSFYPNPAKDVLNVKADGTVNVVIYGMNGAVAAAQQIDGNGQIAVSNLPEGTYIYRVSNSNGVLQNGKVQIAK